MVTCTKCGVDNKEEARFCSRCGAALGQVGRPGKPPRDECFGLPYGGAIFGLFIGAIIILWGLSTLLEWELQIGTYALIALGLLIVAGAVYGLTRRRS